ncbi:MAG: UDP-N-acetylmuramoyl-tripeptide--D-alanyl-D-alanine ligase [Candidatus Kuenenbacteria bacterium]
MKKIIQFILIILSKLILWRYKPEVIGITGSVGKTSTKFAVATVLSAGFKVRASQKNYNTEIGVPLAIIGCESPKYSVLGWIRVLIKGMSLLIRKDKNYPDILVLEMAADRKGDIEYLAGFTMPNVGIITAVGPAHLEFFGDVDVVLQEKASMLDYLKENGCAVLNMDDEKVAGLPSKREIRVIGYGLNDQAQVRAENIYVDKEKGGLNFKLGRDGSYVPVRLPYVLGKPGVYSALAAASTGIYYGMHLLQIAEKLKEIRPVPGRLQLLSGIKNTRIIDDSYNSSPLSVKAALEVLLHLNCTGDKFAVLGDMLELGEQTEQAHKQVGEEVASMGIDYLITVGERSTDTALAAKEYGMNEDRIYNFDNAEEAGKFLQDKMQEGDLILIKGSRGIKCEKIVKEIMAEPEKAKDLLVGQEE